MPEVVALSWRPSKEGAAVSIITLFKQVLTYQLCVWVGICTYALLSSASGLLTVHDYDFQPYEQISVWTFYVWLPWFLLTPVALRYSRTAVISPGNWVPGLLAHLPMLLVLALVHGYIVAHLYYNSGTVSPEMQGYEPWQHTGHFLFMDDMFLFDTVIYIFLIASRNISNFHSLAQQKELDALRMQGLLTQSRLQALLNQVNPHFLFNTLNSIAVLVRRQDTDGATMMIEKLSGFLRYTLDAPVGPWVTLREELAMVDQYVDIEQVRFGARLSVRRAVPPEALECLVPMLILQPLVENAIRHGVGRKAGPCELGIDATLQEQVLQLRIADTGAGCDFAAQTQSVGIGLANVRERLQHSYGEAASMQLEGRPGAGVTVTLRLPLRLAAEVAP